jgi:hypothetical protein
MKTKMGKNPNDSNAAETSGAPPVHPTRPVDVMKTLSDKH